MNIFAYRLPSTDGNAPDTVVYASERLLDFNSDTECHGWLFAPFADSSDIHLIPADIRMSAIPDEEILTVADMCRHPFMTTPRSRHMEYVADIVSRLRMRDCSEKTVAACTLTILRSIKPSEIFHRLSEHYPDAFVFLFAAEGYGAWIGATPETFMRRHDDSWHTMALAGTRPAGSVGEWDEKNLEEQQIVTDYISDALRKSGLKVTLGEKRSKKAGKIEHLITPLSASGEPICGVRKLLEQLSPTPALCGYPKEQAMQMITDGESTPRMLYGGFAGIMSDSRNFDLYVNLRSAIFRSNAIMLYAGGGITRHSDPLEEWIETRRKLDTLLNCL